MPSTSPRRRRPAARRGPPTVLAVLITVLVVAATAGTASAATLQPLPGTPTTGAVTATVFDLAEVGYQQSEHVLSGTATAYAPGAGTPTPLPADGRWAVEPSGETAPYATRLTVFAPQDPAAFSGTVFVEWLNVSNQADTAPDWTMAHREMTRRGHVWIGVSAQAVGVAAARALEPSRYAATLTHPGDSFSYDIFTQAGEAVRTDAAALLGGLAPERVIALGESQSASRLVTYINAVHPLEGAYDGYLVHSRGRTGANLRQSPLPAVPAATPTQIRSDLDVPVLVLQAEDDVLRSPDVRQADTELLRYWEMAGTSHGDNYTLGIGQFDLGDGESRMFQRMLQPTNDPLPGLLPPCPAPVNAGPHSWIVRSAVAHLDRWVAGAGAPPVAPRLELTGAPNPPSYLATAVRDAHGIAVGGIRTPHVDVPVATLSGIGNEGGVGFCRLFGTTTPFSAEELAALYRNHGAFTSAWVRATNATVKAGFFLAEDADAIKAAGAESDVGKR